MTFEAMSTTHPTEHVADLRGRLIFLGYLAPPTAGTFDDWTEAAVRHYQAVAGHDQTGVVDETLWLQLCADTDSSGYTYDQAAAGHYDGYGEPTTLTEHTDYRTIDLRNVLNDLATAITALAGHHALGIGSACGYFDVYAKDRLKALGGRYTGSDYLKNLARHLAGTGGIGITKILTAGLAATGIGAPAAFAIASLWIGFSMTAERKIGNAAKDALADKDDLEAAIPGLTLAISTEVMAEFAGLERDMKAAIDDLITKINNNVPLDGDTVAWLEPLLSAGPAGRDRFIEREVGIPTNTDAVRDGVYHLLIEAFEEMVLTATEYHPSPFDAAAASLLQGAHSDRYASPEAVERARQDEKHHRAQEAADHAAQKLPHVPPPHPR